MSKANAAKAAVELQRALTFYNHLHIAWVDTGLWGLHDDSQKSVKPSGLTVARILFSLIMQWLGSSKNDSIFILSHPKIWRENLCTTPIKRNIIFLGGSNLRPPLKNLEPTVKMKETALWSCSVLTFCEGKFNRFTGSWISRANCCFLQNRV